MRPVQPGGVNRFTDYDPMEDTERNHGQPDPKGPHNRFTDYDPMEDTERHRP
jgi:hypothetical protein